MIRRALALICFAASATVLTAAGRPAPPFPHARLNVANGCLVESVYFYDQFRERFGGDAWVRVLQWGAKEAEEVVAGHAVAVFEFKDRLWTWDVNYGFFPLDLPPAQRDDVDRVSRLVLVKYPRIISRDPLYRFDFPQSPEAEPPAAVLLDEDGAWRDASLVAEKLARHRPVNLVRFSYLADGTPKRSAAVVFMFHGRYCIYSPDWGTVPFHAQGSVKNLRLVQEALRRMFPGAVVLKAPSGE
ncbi:MAG: hypothetical protein WC485_08925 [Opitutaceae bacterium]